MSETVHIKRRHLRKEWIAPIQFAIDGQWKSGFTETLSEGGLYIQTPQSPRAHERIELKFELPGEVKIEVTAEVRHHLDSTYGSLSRGFGAQFLDLKEADRIAIAKFLEAP